MVLLMDKYENITLVDEDIHALRELEKVLGITIPSIEKVAWEDNEIDKQTHLITQFTQHQFGFVVRENRVIGLGLSYQSINKPNLSPPQLLPKISLFKHLEMLDLNHWDVVFEKYMNEVALRQNEFQRSINAQFRNIEERRKAQDDARRNLHMPFEGISFLLVLNEIKNLQNLTYLDFSHCGLDSIDSLKNLSNLRFLDLSYNNISLFPKDFKSLETLEAIFLQYNPLGEFPEDFKLCKRLTTLDISNTRIKTIPEFVSDFHALENLILPLQINTFPQSMVHLTKLKTIVTNHVPIFLNQLVSLEHIYLSSSNEEILPSAITSLPNLRELVISDCRRITSLPAEIGNLEKLEKLVITGNTSLTSLPESILELKNLKELNLHNNNLKSFLSNLGKLPLLELLTLTNNNLEHLPYSLFKLNNLIDFSISFNPLELNDKLISAKTLPEIKEYCKKKMAIKIFISHAVSDYIPCRLEELSKFLEAQLEVDVAYLCELDLSGNIDGFMDKYIPKSQLILFIATPTSVNSVDCQYELKLSREYDIQIIPVKAKELDWGNLAKIGLNRELGIECDFSDVSHFDEFQNTLYVYIQQLKRQIDLQNKEQGKIDRLTIGLKVVERKLDELSKKVEEMNHRLSEK